MDLEQLCRRVERFDLYRTQGRVCRATGLLSCSLPAAVGDQCEIVLSPRQRVMAEVIGFADRLSYLLPYERTESVRPGMEVVGCGAPRSAPIGEGLLGRVLDGLGRPIDGLGPLRSCRYKPCRDDVPPPMQRADISQPFLTGQRALDALLTCGRGQRVGIFGGSGVGKSVLLGEIAKGSCAEVNVIALVGERGRELRPFLDECLGSEGRKRSVVVVATSDQPPLMRVRSVQLAITIADDFRQRGMQVLLMMDSLTRFAMAQRELGLLLGEPPSARGYTPSVFQLMANSLERLGNAEWGSITGIVTVLVDGDDMEEPIADAARALLDGHMVLDRRLAERGHYPAINVGRSISRISRNVTDDAWRRNARKIRGILATFAEVEDLLRIGAYVRGSSAQVDRAVELMPEVETFLRQEIDERVTREQTLAAMEAITLRWPF